jgi:hypothetical protein
MVKVYGRNESFNSLQGSPGLIHPSGRHGGYGGIGGDCDCGCRAISGDGAQKRIYDDESILAFIY